MKKLIIISATLFFATLASAQRERLLLDLRGSWKFNIGDKEYWKDESYDDEEWQSIFVPAAWENEGFSGYDGFAWYRKTFDLPLKGRSQYITFDAGYIDDADEVYLNGQLIGMDGSMPPHFRTAYNSHRRYTVPTTLLKDRNNVIAIRVYDKSIDGGIIKGRIGFYENTDVPQSIYPLSGVWKFNNGDNFSWSDADYDDEEWENAMIPGTWKGYKDYSFTKFWGSDISYAWYRKQFVIPEYLENRSDLVLILGKIDDFDRTYLNGHLIGETDDGEPFGSSRSYEELRIYAIPPQYLNDYGINTIAVRVKDIGGDAGIYEGPIVICREQDVRQALRAF
ncbi:MAG: beta galactosidase jelly roll domain-containing protein [Cyclobacteriaceae bacterium]